MCKNQLIFWLILLLLGNTQAATYYVSTGGDDGNNGTADTSPWKTLGKVYAKAMSGSKFAPGDAILLKAGDVFNREQITLTSGNSGTAGNPIFIGRYGSGNDPIILGETTNLTWSAVNGHAGVYSAPMTSPSAVDAVGIGSVSLSQRTQGADSLDTFLGKFTASQFGFSWDTPTLIYVRTANDASPANDRLFYYVGVQLNSASYIVVTNLNIQRFKMGIQGNTSSGTVVTKCSLADTISTSIYFGAGSSGVTVASNTVNRCGYTAVYFQTGGNNWVHHNTISYVTNTIFGIAVNGTELAGVGLERGTNNIVERNDFLGLGMSVVDFWYEVGSVVRYNYAFHTGGATYPHGTGLKVYYNVFDVDGGNGFGGLQAYSAANSPIFDTNPNITYNNVLNGFVSYGIYCNPLQSTNTIFKNNILVTHLTTTSMAEIGGSITLDNNLWWCDAGSPKQWVWDGTAHSTWAAYKSASGQDSHSVMLDPQFAGGAGATKFALASQSPAINAGSTMFGDADYSGHSTVGATDIGAFEYGASQQEGAPDSGGGIRAKLARVNKLVLRPGGVPHVPYNPE
ncbi:exported hypothetical protein [Gammaproteobacteria bacterium]